MNDYRIRIDLTTAQGNAFYILGVAKQLSKSLKMDFDIVQKKMTAGDYENLLKVFEDYFGDFVTIYRWGRV